MEIKTYLTVNIDGEIDGEVKRRLLEGDLLLSESTNNYFKWKNNVNNQDFSIEYVNFLENAKEGLELALIFLQLAYLFTSKAKEKNLSHKNIFENPSLLKELKSKRKCYIYIRYYWHTKSNLYKKT